VQDFAVKVKQIRSLWKAVQARSFVFKKTQIGQDIALDSTRNSDCSGRRTRRALNRHTNLMISSSARPVSFVRRQL